MARQTSRQLVISDSLVGNNQKLNQRLDKICCLVSWNPFEDRFRRSIFLSKRKAQLSGFVVVQMSFLASLV